MATMGKLLVCSTVVLAVFGGGTSAFAQDMGASGAENAVANPGVPASAGKLTKAQRKAARKEARAKKNAELKKLEEQGYQPSRNDVDYPQNLQNAQKKATPAQGASH